jgi:UPF0716 protein FxsA
MMWVVLLLMFTVFPAVEIFLLLQMGAAFGPLTTFAFVLLTGVLGAWLAKREGFAVLAKLSDEMRTGLPPGPRIAEGALVLVGGVLLITPGVLTDLTGILLIFPPTRRFLAPRVVRFVSARLGLSVAAPAPDPEAPPAEGVRVRTGGPRPQPAQRKATPFSTPFDD